MYINQKPNNVLELFTDIYYLPYNKSMMDMFYIEFRGIDERSSNIQRSIEGLLYDVLENVDAGLAWPFFLPWTTINHMVPLITCSAPGYILVDQSLIYLILYSIQIWIININNLIYKYAVRFHLILVMVIFISGLPSKIWCITPLFDCNIVNTWCFFDQP